MRHLSVVYSRSVVVLYCFLSATDVVNSFDIKVNANSALLRKPDTKFVGSIDQGTSSSRFLVFTDQGDIAASAQVELSQIFHPENEGWHEHSPLELWENTRACMNAVGNAIAEEDLDLCLSAIGITNQRETTIAWNRATGEPYHNAIVWDDVRTNNIVKEVSCSREDNVQVFRDRAGLPINSYFSGTKIKWLLDNVDELRVDVHDSEKCKDVCFGTVDAWLLYKLTNGEKFATDVSNASRWLFMNLKTCQFEQDLVDRICSPHKLPISCLPEICPSSGVFGATSMDCGLINADFFNQVPLSGILGDQQAALFGQTAFQPGDAKNTYGTGLFLMMNTGKEPVPSNHGLLTTVAYQLGKDEDVIYGLEGGVSHSGSTIQWLRDQLRIIDSAQDAQKYAEETKSNQGLYMVPAFAGLFSPHWNENARACIVGMTAGHHRGHVCRAAIEASCYQTRDIFDAITKDSGVSLTELKVDGGATINELMMQFQSDVLDVPVVKPKIMETTALGTAYAAGLAVGVWENLQEIKQLWGVAEIFEPKMTDQERAKNLKGWNKAVQRSLDWIDDDE